jgi:hypothetical protein
MDPKGAVLRGDLKEAMDQLRREEKEARDHIRREGQARLAAYETARAEDDQEPG